MISDYNKLMQILRLKGVVSLCSNSKNVEPNCAFFALRGQKYNGNDFINEVLAQGAVVAITDSVNCDERVINVLNVKEALQFCALAFYDKLPKNLALITGTNGKTSVAHYFQQILALTGQKSASIGTLGCNANVHLQDPIQSTLTTPDFLDLRITLNRLANLGVEYVGIEASSIALTQNRFFSIKATIAAFTSFGSDHLDYHVTKENYLHAKLNLFDQHLTEGDTIVIQERLVQFLPKHILKKQNIISISPTKGSLEYQIKESSIKGQHVTFKFNNKAYHFSTDIIGNYQAENLLTALILVHQLGIELSLIVQILPHLSPPSGRLERVQENIFIDYAHNEDALSSVLAEIHKIKNPNQKIWLLFGCGGERDAQKRAAMGKVANASADVIIVTDDNPRNEDPTQIRKAIISTCTKAIEIPDREKAIIYAVHNLPKDEILIVAGKGHETCQIIQEKKIPFVEKTIIINAIKTRPT
jgi:UDP-N-acetylmuramoyl-L-alanyl-D-glutamate--2,6-diaminopimelate ligase